jgi:hypothetical protein
VQSDIVQLGEGAYSDDPVRQLFNAFETGNPSDVYEPGRFCDPNASPVEEFRSPGENHGIRRRSERDRLMNGRRPCIAEVLHQAFLLATAFTAAAIWGYAEHLQMFPLIHSRISEFDPVCPSATHATADMICPDVQYPH